MGGMNARDLIDRALGRAREPGAERDAPVLKKYFLGLDLGQAKDYSALAVVEREGEAREDWLFTVRALSRYPLRTAYPSIVEDVAKRLRDHPLPARRGEEISDEVPTLGVDATGVGAAVIDLFRREKDLKADLRPILIVGGTTVKLDGDTTHVPKRGLVGAVEVPLQNARLKIPKKLAEAETLRKELENFQIKITAAANDVYGAWREGTHDDLVLALAVALWLATEETSDLEFTVVEWE
jgi:hypothetical protein